MRCASGLRNPFVQPQRTECEGARSLKAQEWLARVGTSNTAPMHTVRMTVNVDKDLLDEVVEAHPGVTKTALVEEGLRALLARDASERLARLGGKAPRARAPKRSAWKKS